jgi:hypothetical protein
VAWAAAEAAAGCLFLLDTSAAAEADPQRRGSSQRQRPQQGWRWGEPAGAGEAAQESAAEAAGERQRQGEAAAAAGAAVAGAEATGPAAVGGEIAAPPHDDAGGSREGVVCARVQAVGAAEGAAAGEAADEPAAVDSAPTARGGSAGGGGEAALRALRLLAALRSLLADPLVSKVRARCDCYKPIRVGPYGPGGSRSAAQEHMLVSKVRARASTFTQFGASGAGPWPSLGRSRTASARADAACLFAWLLQAIAARALMLVRRLDFCIAGGTRRRGARQTLGRRRAAQCPAAAGSQPRGSARSARRVNSSSGLGRGECA